MNTLKEMQLLRKCGNTRNVDMSSLPPCKRSLVQHVRRVNYQVGVWRRAHLPESNIANPIPDHGWEMKDDQIQPLWFEGEIMPINLVDILEQELSKENEDISDTGDSTSEIESDIDSSEDIYVITANTVNIFKES